MFVLALCALFGEILCEMLSDTVGVIVTILLAVLCIPLIIAEAIYIDIIVLALIFFFTDMTIKEALYTIFGGIS